MADTSTPTLSISKLKVAGPEERIKDTRLSTVGNKTELMERLQEALQGDGTLSLEPDSGTGDDRDAEDLIDEDDVLAEDESLDLGDDVKEDAKLSTPSAEESEEPKTPPKKIVLKRSSVSILEKENQEEKPQSEEEKDEKAKPKIIKLTKLTELERLEMRAKKFGASVESNEKKSGTLSGEISPVADQEEKLKKRQERFGIVSSTDSELKTKRGNRFATSGAKTAISVSPDDAEKLKKRAERFKINK